MLICCQDVKIRKKVSLPFKIRSQGGGREGALSGTFDKPFGLWGFFVRYNPFTSTGNLDYVISLNDRSTE
jgi:hypothetical protein